MFRRAPFRGGRGRRTAVDIVVCLGWGEFSCVFFSILFFFERTRPTASMRPPLASFTPLLVMRQGRESEATDPAFFAFRAKKRLTGVRTGCHYLNSLSVCVCVTWVVFTDYESCTRPISTNPGSMEAGQYGLTRGTCFIACRLVLHTVAGLSWISWLC